MVLDSGFTVAQVLAQNLGLPNPGTLDYNFPFSLGAGGTYTQTGTPPFPPVSEIPGIIGLTATLLVPGSHVCSGFNNAGATINVDPTNAASIYETILGCDGFTTASNGFPVSSTSTIPLDLGTVTSTSESSGNVITTVTVVEAEDTTTTWTTSAQVNGASVPEPASAWLAAAGFAGLWAILARRRRRA